MARPKLSSQRAWVAQATSRATAWLDEHRAHNGTVDVVARLYERDHDAFGSVLGSAIALRLFLFVLWAIVAMVGALNVFHLEELVTRGLEESATAGQMAKDITDASETSGRTGLGLMLSGVVLTLWAGQSLTRVLAASAAGAWALSAHQAKTTLRTAGSLSGVLVAVTFALLLAGRLRDVGGVAAGGVSWVATAAMFSFAWFAVMWTLPSGTRDPGAQIPGAALVGVGFAAVQWFMQWYLPNRIADNSDLVGSLAFTVALLGYLFVVGRLMATSFVVSAVLFERFGSLSELFFSLPVVRGVPRRWPRVARFFDLGDSPPAGEELVVQGPPEPEGG